MKNAFFQRAQRKAVDVATRKHRLLNLVAQLFRKMQGMNWKEEGLQSAKSRLSVFGRLSKAYALGQYRNIPWKTLLIIVAAILYFVNPFDLLPDLIPIAGFTDDFGVLLWAYSAVNKEIDKFLAWEQSQISAS